MLEHIERMKQKPEHIRRRYAFVVSFSISALIFVGWVSSYGISTSPVVAEKKVIESPATSLTASAIGVFKDIKSIFVGSNSVEYNSQIEVTGGER
jgi:uncharacterized membrane protein